MSEVVKSPIIPTADANNHGNQSLLLVISMTVEDEKISELSKQPFSQRVAVAIPGCSL